MPKVVATFDNGERSELFEFHPDEIMFDEGELVGMTEEESARPQAWLRTSHTCGAEPVRHS